nr:PREDICTED: splicing factor, proline- and glutamine-rich-like [Bemisia tabaci]
MHPPPKHRHPPPTHMHLPPKRIHQSPNHMHPPPTHMHPPPTHMHPPPTHMHPPPTHMHPPPTQVSHSSSSGPKGVSTATVGGSGPAGLGGPQTAPTRATPWSANGRVETTCRKVRRAFRGMALPPAYLHFQAEVASPRKRSSVGGMPYHGVLKGPSGGSSPRTSDRPRGRTFTGSGGG